MLKVKDIMNEDVFTLQADETLAHLRALMDAKHIRHVPIIDADNRFVGLLSQRDLLAQTISMFADIDEKEQEDLDRSISLFNVMKRDIIAADPDMDLRTAIAIMLKHKYGCLPVVAEDKLVGIVTEADFLKLTLSMLEPL